MPTSERGDWVQQPIDIIQPWLTFNGVKLHNAELRCIKDKGIGICASSDISSSGSHDQQNILLSIPQDLILSRERVQEHAKVDQDFRKVLERLGEFAENNRISILVFLLCQSLLVKSSSSNNAIPRFGVHTTFATYLTFLTPPSSTSSSLSLPTFYTPSELDLFIGTTLYPATTAKLKSLQSEFDTFNNLLSSSPISHILPHIPFIRWIQIDALYRSRALDLPIFDDSFIDTPSLANLSVSESPPESRNNKDKRKACFIPILDMANHASFDNSSALYEFDSDGNAVLILKPGRSVRSGEEINISYGSEKGACEMIFSYGFLDQVERANELFLDLRPESDDPLGQAKLMKSGVAPGVRIFQSDTTRGENEVEWESDWIWFVIVNHEDGLEFKVSRQVTSPTTSSSSSFEEDPEREVEELHCFWKDVEITSAINFKSLLENDTQMWNVYQLRAITLILQRVDEQSNKLSQSEAQVSYAKVQGEDEFEDEVGTSVRKPVRDLALNLRKLEEKLLKDLYMQLEKVRDGLVESDTVRAYLARYAEREQNEHEDTGHEHDQVENLNEEEMVEDFS